MYINSQLKLISLLVGPFESGCAFVGFGRALEKVKNRGTCTRKSFFTVQKKVCQVSEGYLCRRLCAGFVTSIGLTQPGIKAHIEFKRS